MQILIIIVSDARKELLEQCLLSIYRSIGVTDINYNIIIIANGDAITYHAISKEQRDNLEIYLSEKCSPASARNIAIDRAISSLNPYDYILFLDDDIIVPKLYFSRLSKILNMVDIDVLGGPDKTINGESLFGQLVGLSISLPIVSGKTFFRHTQFSRGLIKADEGKLILCNLLFTAELFKDNTNRFRGDFFRNEENVLIERLQREQKKMYYSDDLFVYHRRKKNIFLLSKSYFKSGFFRIKQFYNFPQNIKYEYLLPPIFVTVLCVFASRQLPMIDFIVWAYIACSLACSAKALWGTNLMKYIWVVIFLNLIIVVSYGFGAIASLLISFRDIINNSKFRSTTK